MRIVVHGQQAFGCAVLEKLLARKENVVAVCVAPDQKGRPIDPLKELALENKLPVHQPASWKTAQSLALMQSFDADLCMMAYVLLLVPEAVLNAPRHGSFQYHPSLLPMHRGPSSINWPIATGASETGLTIFWPDAGLDEGPVLLQKTCAIGPDETLGDMYFQKLFPMGVEAMLESLDLVKQGRAPKDRAEPRRRLLRIVVRQSPGATGLEPAGASGLQRHPRRQSPARRVDPSRRDRVENLRQRTFRRQRARAGG